MRFRVDSQSVENSHDAFLRPKMGNVECVCLARTTKIKLYAGRITCTHFTRSEYRLERMFFSHGRFVERIKSRFNKIAFLIAYLLQV